MKILLVDDAPEVQDFVHASMPSGCSLDYAGTLKIGVEMAEETPYDLIITDLMMPDVSNGDALTVLLKAFPGTPIMVLTQMHFPAYASSLIRQGAVDVAFKPDGAIEPEVAQRQLGETMMFAKARFDYHQQQMVSTSANAAAIEELKREIRELRKDGERLARLEKSDQDDNEKMRELWKYHESREAAKALALAEAAVTAEHVKGKWMNLARIIGLIGTGLAAIIGPWAASKWKP